MSLIEGSIIRGDTRFGVIDFLALKLSSTINSGVDIIKGGICSYCKRFGSTSVISTKLKNHFTRKSKN